MSYTRLVAWSIIPFVLVVVGLTDGTFHGSSSEGQWVFLPVGVIAEAFVLARFFDRRRNGE